MLKLTYFVLFFFTVQYSFSQTINKDYTLDWSDYRTADNNWAEGSTNNTLTVDSDDATETTDVTIKMTGQTSTFVEKGNSAVPGALYDMPSVQAFYDGFDSQLVSAVELSEWNPSKIITYTITFSEMVTDVNFKLFDVDANTSADTGTDRKEVIYVTGYDGPDTSTANKVFPAVTTGSANTLVGANNNGVAGVSSADRASSDGDASLQFNTPIQQIKLFFNIRNIGSNPSLNAEPGFAIGDISYKTIITNPVTLLSFSLKSLDDNVELYWQTAMEDNTDYFLIEKSFNGLDFELVRKITAAGYSSEIIDYNYIDRDAFSSTNSSIIYKLTQVDVDGSYEIFPLQSITKPAQLAVYPSILSRGESMQVTGEDIEQIQIYNSAGVLVEQKYYLSSKRNIAINTSSYGLGMYIVVVNQNQAIKIIIH